MNVGLGHDEVKPPVESRFGDSIEQLERIGEPHIDRFAPELADETIIMAPATTQTLSFESEGNAGNTHENFRKTFAVENF